MIPKKVELTELFYDLVFVYAISKMTGLIHHLHDGVISGLALFTFVTCLLAVVNVWVYQSVYTNRYGQNSFWDIGAFFINMALILIMSNCFTTENWESIFLPYALTTGLTTLVLAIQYLVQYFRTKDSGDKELTKQYSYILLIRTALIMISAILPYHIGIVLFFIGLFSGVLLPFLINPKMRPRPINFPHLVERFSLLVIITFGEMLIGITPYFTLDNLSFASFLVFLLVASLFLYYIVEIDHLIDHHRKKETGIRLIYWHYPIFIGLSLITVSFSFLQEEVNHLFLLGLLYGGLLLFYAGVHAQSSYNKPTARYPKFFIWTQVALFGGGFFLSLFSLQQLPLVLLITSSMTALISLHYIHFAITKVISKE